MSKALIKKYPNRRLYDTNASSYITLNDLLKMIYCNKDFKVVDSKTNEDITKNVLIQIILEQETKGYNLLPISFLKQIISCYRTSPNAYMGEFSKGLQSAFNLLYSSFTKKEENKNE